MRGKIANGIGPARAALAAVAAVFISVYSELRRLKVTAGI
jgi:hypothetical protein